jgi:hypothetical protein
MLTKTRSVLIAAVVLGAASGALARGLNNNDAGMRAHAEVIGGAGSSVKPRPICIDSLPHRVSRRKRLGPT